MIFTASGYYTTEDDNGLLYLWDEGGFDCTCPGWEDGNNVGLRIVNPKEKTWLCPYCKKWNPLAQIVIDTPRSLWGIAPG